MEYQVEILCAGMKDLNGVNVSAWTQPNLVTDKLSFSILHSHETNIAQATSREIKIALIVAGLYSETNKGSSLALTDENLDRFISYGLVDPQIGSWLVRNARPHNNINAALYSE
jgi:hypothetical protein